MNETEFKQPGESYDDFYARGGGRYDLLQETAFLFFRIVAPLGVGRDCRALEIGCGTGLHAEALSRLVVAVDAVDLSVAGIEIAASSFPGPKFTQGDAADFLRRAPDGHYDLIFARGMSWFHYALEPGRSPFAIDALMVESMRSLRPGGHFVLQIRTDFTGRTDDTGIRHHRYRQLRRFAGRFGETRMFTDWAGLPLTNGASAIESGRNAIVAIRKVTREDR